MAKLYVRSFYQSHSLRLIQAGDTISDMRASDTEWVELELLGELETGRKLPRGNAETPESTHLFRIRQALANGGWSCNVPF